ncbi:MAG: DUF6242 domain-containing protein [Tannerellaceae bacterium]|nr:DUF6242 domain-containing protein [Tannerellaceae bacterium]
MNGFVAMLMTSCLGGSEEADLTLYKDAQIATFVLSHDSAAYLKNVSFTIDQINGTIFNYDSLPYGTKVEKVICSMTYRGGYTAGVKVLQEAVGDSAVAWNGTDSLNFSKPVQFTVYAYDGFNKKVYKAYINIHQVQPDSLAWTRLVSPVTGIAAVDEKVVEFNGEWLMFQKTNNAVRLFTSVNINEWAEVTVNGLPLQANLAQISSFGGCLYAAVTDGLQISASGNVAQGQLYSSSDGKNWKLVENTPKIVTLLGALKADRNKSAVLAAIIEADAGLSFAGMTEDGQWTKGEAVPDGFPRRAFGSVAYERLGFEYLMIATGLDKNNKPTNTVWATSDALQWALLSRSGRADFSEREGAALTVYDGKFFLLGGLDKNGAGLKDIYFSKDNGITWAANDSLILFPGDYAGRGYSSIATDSYNYIYMFGGKTLKDVSHTDEIWRGRIFRLGFDKEK